MSSSSITAINLEGAYGSALDVFPSTCTILEKPTTPTYNVVGQDVTSFTPVAGLVNIKCRITPLILARPTDIEESQIKLTVRTIERLVLLNGYANVSELNRLQDDSGIVWEIVSVQHDGNNSITRIRIRRDLS